LTKSKWCSSPTDRLRGDSMDIIQIVGIALATTVILSVIKGQVPQISFLISLFVGTAIFLMLLTKVSAVVLVLEKLAIQAQVNLIFLETILKIIGIAYIAEFGAQVVRDAGEGAIAGKVELAGKVLIMVLAIPIISVIMESIIHLLP
jgi:stage III sporulation protein AD